MKKFNNFKRLKSIFLDLGVLFIIGVIISVPCFVFKNKIELIYYYNFEMSLLYSLFFCKDVFGGQSIGKRFYKLKVANNRIKEDKEDENTELNQIRLILRNLFVYIWPIEIILLLYQEKRLGDIIVKTKVIPFVDEKNVIRSKDVIKNLAVFILVFAIMLLLTFSALFLLS